jgi:internalin A
MVASEAEGRAEALRRIAACRAARAEELDLGGLQLTALDGELLAALCQLGWLRRLFLGPSAEVREKPQLAFTYREKNSKVCNALSALPGALFDALTRLERLDLALNQLRGLPASIANLVNLTDLDLAANGIGAEGAQALKGLVNLTSLELSINGIGDEGAQALKDLVNLTSLNLPANDIGAEGAQALKDLINLTSLYLSANDIRDEGAQALKGLVNLTSLYLNNNGIGAEGAQALKGLVNLTSLYLNYNGIGDEGAQALKGLVNLTSLYLNYNDIGEICPLVSLRNLREINLSASHLDHDVPAFWMLPSLQEAILHEASLPGVPVEILSENYYDNCLDRLRAHLADLTGDDVAVGNVKLMILGNGRVGKTQICRRLRGESFDESVPSTHGIEVSSLPLAPQIFDAPVTLKIWDFGGQDIYYGTHALFLKSCAIFTLASVDAQVRGGTIPHAWRLHVSQPAAGLLGGLRAHLWRCAVAGARHPIPM